MIKYRYYCIVCASETDKPVHHRKPKSQGGSNSVENICPVCPKCHDWIHSHSQDAIKLGFYIPSYESERAYWKDFPHSRIREY